MKRTPVDIIVLNFEGLKFTKMLVESLYKNTEYPFNLIIVDNASEEEGTKEFFEELKNKYNNVIIHYNTKRDNGFAEGCNAGLRYSSSEYAMFLNNDILIPEKDWLTKLVESLERDPLVAIVGCKLLYPDETIQQAGCSLSFSFFRTGNVWDHRGRFESREKHSEVEELMGVTFACILFKKELFGRIDESYLTGSFEDCDKCCEVRSKGYKIIYDGRVSLYHFETATNFRRDQDSWKKIQWKNSLLFRKKWFEWTKKDLVKNYKLYGWSKERVEEELESLKK